MATWKEIKQRIKAISTDKDRVALAVWFLESIANGEQPHPDKCRMIVKALRG